MIISKSKKFCCSTDSIAIFKYFSPLKTGMPILINGAVFKIKKIKTL
jgi:hypothetical protein